MPLEYRISYLLGWSCLRIYWDWFFWCFCCYLGGSWLRVSFWVCLWFVCRIIVWVCWLRLWSRWDCVGCCCFVRWVFYSFLSTIPFGSAVWCFPVCVATTWQMPRSVWWSVRSSTSCRLECWYTRCDRRFPSRCSPTCRGACFCKCPAVTLGLKFFP